MGDKSPKSKTKVKKQGAADKAKKGAAAAAKQVTGKGLKKP